MIASIIANKEETASVRRLVFTKPQGFSFIAGQFIRLTLENIENDPRGPSRFFSAAAAPSEEHLFIATNISDSSFKQALAKLTPGDQITLAGPYGKFVLSEDTQKLHVFLAGGIGITPIHSILQDATEKNLPHKLLLLYSNKTPDDIVFKTDLEAYAKQNPNLTIVYTFTRSTNESPNNVTIQQYNNTYLRTGRIDEALIKQYAQDLPNTIFYICGPPTMVEALVGLVKNLGVNEDTIKAERFTGYQ